MHKDANENHGLLALIHHYEGHGNHKISGSTSRQDAFCMMCVLGAALLCMTQWLFFECFSSRAPGAFGTTTSLLWVCCKEQSVCISTLHTTYHIFTTRSTHTLPNAFFDHCQWVKQRVWTKIFKIALRQIIKMRREKEKGEGEISKFKNVIICIPYYTMAAK